MIPLRDVIPSRTTPVVTIVIIVLNALAFLFELIAARCRAPGVHPRRGASSPPRSRGPPLISSMFLHGGWLHFLGNMWYLWIFGDNVEDRLGHGRYLVFYLLCGAVAGLAQTLVNPDSYVPTIGASGAIAGVMGAYFVLYPHSRVLTLIPLFIFIEIIEIPRHLLPRLLVPDAAVQRRRFDRPHDGHPERRHRLLGARCRVRGRARRRLRLPPAAAAAGRMVERLTRKSTESYRAP